MSSHPGADSSSFWLCVLVLTGQLDEPEPENVKRVELRVPRTAALQCVWSFSDFSPYRLLSLPARLFGCTSPSLWMLSVCLAEIEKHKGNRFYRSGVFSAVPVRPSHFSVVPSGVGVITAPVNVTARFKEPLLVPGRVTITFWETTKHQGQSSSAQGLGFHMQQHGGHISHMMGLISRS